MEIPVGFWHSKMSGGIEYFNKSIQKLDAGALDKIILDNSIVKTQSIGLAGIY